jgi:hypothetical protein
MRLEAFLFLAIKILNGSAEAHSNSASWGVNARERPTGKRSVSNLQFPTFNDLLYSTLSAGR